MKTWLQQLVSDGESPSTGRVVVLLIVAPIMIVWTVLCIKRGDFIVPDAKIVSLVVAAVGGKTLQSFAESLTTPHPGCLPIASPTQQRGEGVTAGETPALPGNVIPQPSTQTPTPK